MFVCQTLLLVISAKPGPATGCQFTILKSHLNQSCLRSVYSVKLFSKTFRKSDTSSSELKNCKSFRDLKNLCSTFVDFH